MSHLLIIICIFSAAQAGCLGGPQTDLTSIDIISLQAGIGFYPDVLLNRPPGVTASLLKIKGYWGKNIAFVGGAELVKGRLVLGLYETGSGSTPMAGFPTGEALTVQAGIAWLGKRQSSCLFSEPYNEKDYFVPRAEFLTGISPVCYAVDDYRLSFGAIRSELNFMFQRFAGLQLEHRFYPSRNVLAPYGTFDITLYATLGWDKLSNTREN